VSGYVGNKAAVFPLQLLGFDVDVINSVQFSNHTGYDEKWSGDVLSGEMLESLVGGMERNGLLTQVTHLMTGYIGSESFLRSVVRVHDSMKAENRALVYLCDPVLGDHGSLYVPEKLVDIYVDEVVRRASILTPNAFELALLSRQRVETHEDVISACDRLHSKFRVHVIVVTSVDGIVDDKLRVYCSELQPTSSTRNPLSAQLTVFEVDKLPCAFTGSGDLTAALLLAHFQIERDISLAVRRALASVGAVLKRTLASPAAHPHCKNPELRLIQSRHDILNPSLEKVTVVETFTRNIS